MFASLAADPGARALYLYPTKALSNDQYATIRAMETFTGIPAKPAIYDGDTPQSKRAAIRENARIVISNPHELHHVLSWHAKWSPFFSNLKFVVIDEAHRYRGVFGSQIALLIRRLLRIARSYGSDPQFVLSTATLANPEEFAGRLVGRPFTLVDTDGSPHGTRHFVLYNPFYDGIGERSAHQETKDLLLSCVKGDLQTLCFTGSRKMAELVTIWTREDARRTSARLAQGISAYRAGYLPEERRTIERQLKSGEVRGVVSTNALELGIDIGSLDAVIIDGYPGTMMSARQQAGRAAGKAANRLRCSWRRLTPSTSTSCITRMRSSPARTSMRSSIPGTLTSSPGTCFALRRNCRYVKRQMPGFSGNRLRPFLPALQKAASSKRRPGDGYTQAGAGQPMR